MFAGPCAVTTSVSCRAVGQSDLSHYLIFQFDLGTSNCSAKIVEIQIDSRCSVTYMCYDVLSDMLKLFLWMSVGPSGSVQFPAL